MPDRPWAAHGLVFVGGMHRSGTTLVADIIAGSPDASGLSNTGQYMDEGHNMQDVYPTPWRNTSSWAYDPRLHLTERDARPDAAARLWAAWSPYWDLGRHTLVEKSPPNFVKTRYFQQVFPGARFVVVTRHPVVQALAVRKWATPSTGKLTVGLPRLVDHWLHAHDLLLADAPHVRHLHVLRYEHLMRDPAGEVARLQEFLGFPLLPPTAVDTSRSAGYVDLWQGAGRTGLAARLRRHLRAPADLLRDVGDALLLKRYRRTVHARFAERMRAHGYDPEVLDDAEPWPSRQPAGPRSGS